MTSIFLLFWDECVLDVFPDIHLLPLYCDLYNMFKRKLYGYLFYVKHIYE